MASAAVVAVEVSCHEDTRSAILVGALLPQASHFVVIIDLVKLQHGKLDLLVLVGDALRRGKHLLLALLRATTQAQN